MVASKNTDAKNKDAQVGKTYMSMLSYLWVFGSWHFLNPLAGCIYREPISQRHVANVIEMSLHVVKIDKLWSYHNYDHYVHLG